MGELSFSRLIVVPLFFKYFVNFQTDTGLVYKRFPKLFKIKEKITNEASFNKIKFFGFTLFIFYSYIFKNRISINGLEAELSSQTDWSSITVPTLSNTAILLSAISSCSTSPISTNFIFIIILNTNDILTNLE